MFSGEIIHISTTGVLRLVACKSGWMDSDPVETEIVVMESGGGGG